MRHDRYVTFQLAEVAISRTLFAKILRLKDTAANRPTSPGPFAAMIGLDPEAPRPPGGNAIPRACRSAHLGAHMYHCNRRPIAQLVPHHLETAIPFLDQGPSRVRQPKALPSSVSRRWYPGNLGKKNLATEVALYLIRKNCILVEISF